MQASSSSVHVKLCPIGFSESSPDDKVRLCVVAQAAKRAVILIFVAAPCALSSR